MLEKKMKFKSGKVGSALIMTIVLTVLLSIVAVTFVLVARMDSAATSNISDSKSLDNAAKTIIEIIGRELVFDTPGVANQEYQDYPDANDAWLASIEPYKAAPYYKWRQISDVTGYLKSRNFQTWDISVDPPGTLETIKDDTKIDVAGDGKLENTFDQASADADGDGIADSKWIELTDIRSSKGNPVYAAVRVIDNCAMINVNTAYKFDADTLAADDGYKVDGTSQMQVNLKGLLKTGDKIDDFHKARGGNDATDDSIGWNNYNNQVIWKYDSVPGGSYLPFDISDELELRYRYCIDSKFKSRIENILIDDTLYREGSFEKDYGLLYDAANTDWNLDTWQRRITDANNTNLDGDRRHLLTTYNFDRVIAPDGLKMWDVHSGGSAQLLYERLKNCVDTRFSTVPEAEMHAYLAQFAANVVDRSDSDANVSVVGNVTGNGSSKFYGMERPYIYISEITRNFYTDAENVVHRSYAIELYKEFVPNDEFFDPNTWRLVIREIKKAGGSPASPPFRSVSVESSNFNDRGGQYYVIVFEDSGGIANLSDQVKYSDSPKDGAKNVDPKVTLMWDKFLMGYDSIGNPILSDSYDVYCGTDPNGVRDADGAPPAGGGYYRHVSDIGFRIPKTGFTPSTTYYWKVVGKKDGVSDVKGSVYSFTTWTTKPNDVKETITADEFIFDSGTKIELSRLTVTGYILVDDVPQLPNWLIDENGEGIRSMKRNILLQYQLKGYWYTDENEPGVDTRNATLGYRDSSFPSRSNPIQPWYSSFTNVGDAAMMFIKSTYLKGKDLNVSYTIRLDATGMEQAVRFKVNTPSLQNVFKYITAFNPSGYGNDVNETRVRGRININTAPGFVIAQLPWVGRANGKDLKIADAIVAYRDKTAISGVVDYSGPSGRNAVTGIPDIYESPGFRSIGELVDVINRSGTSKIEYNIRYCGIDGLPQYGYPDLTIDSNNIADDLEEQELIFARISDLATVRSDVFTAYILVRLGTDGPQKRFIAILDRTGVSKNNGNNKVKVAAFQQTPPAR